MRNEEMIAIVECYIHHLKGKEVRIAKPKNHHQFYLLSLAYEKCKHFFIKH